MRRWLALVEERGGAVLERELVRRAGEAAFRAAVAERLVEDAPRATSWPCDEMEDGCPRRIVDNVGDDAHPLVAVCGQRERYCEPVLLTAEECARRKVSISGLHELLRRVFRIESGAIGTIGEGVGVVSLGAQTYGARLRDVVFVQRADNAAVGPLLELREGAVRPTLVLVPTTNALPSAMITRYRPGSHVELVVLEDVLRARGDAVIMAAMAPPSAETAKAPGPDPEPDKRGVARVVMPKVAKWAELRLYKIADQLVSVRAQGGHVRATPFDLGMANAYTRDATVLWALLMKFLEHYGTYAGPPGLETSAAVRQQVRRLGKAMQAIFGVKQKPFEYVKRVGWKSRFRAFPELPAE